MSSQHLWYPLAISTVPDQGVAQKWEFLRPNKLTKVQKSCFTTAFSRRVGLTEIILMFDYFYGRQNHKSLADGESPHIYREDKENPNHHLRQKRPHSNNPRINGDPLKGRN